MVKAICYPTGDEPDPWTKWHSEQSGAVQGKHATVMRFLDAGHWREPYYEPLHGSAAGLFEIRIRDDLQWRLIGYRKEGWFILLVTAYHKGRVWTPRNALKTATRRMKEMEDGLEGIVLNVHPS